MNKLEIYKSFVEGTIEDTPEFMIVEENNEKYLLFDRLVMELSDKAMPWLFKVYLDKNYNIIRDDKFTKEIKHKYNNLDLKIKDVSGNMFLNKDSMYVILNELNLHKQLVYKEETSKFQLK